MKLTRLAILITLTYSALPALATEFNAGLLNAADDNNIDLSAFSRDGYIAPGNYLLDIWLNDQSVREQYPVSVVPVTGSKSSVICVTPGMVDLLGLKDDIIRSLKPVPGADGGRCLDLHSADSRIRYSAAEQRLTFSLPQAWMQYQDLNWTPPSRWSNGVAGALLDYNLMANRYMPQQGESSTSYSLYGTAGLNLGAWRLRSDYQYSRYDSGGNGSQSDFYLPQTYLFRPLPGIQSRLTLGQTYLSSAIFDSFRFAGLTLASDERMLPPSLQGYAPQISGIANSNAQVTVSQNGRILYQTRVSPGPFVLPDLSQNISGNLDVSVRESDGTVRTWQVNTASVPFMARKGQLRYKVAGGRPLYGGPHNNRAVSPDFLLGEATWGAFNNTSLYGGVIASAGDYQSVALGAGQNMGELGALSVDVTRAEAQIPHAERQTGYSYRINYAKTFDKTGSTLAFVGYRFSDRHYLSLPDYLQRVVSEYGDVQREKQSYTITYNQYFSGPAMSAALSVSRLNYWNAAPNNNYMLSLNKSFSLGSVQGITASLSLARNQYAGGGTQNQVYASVSVPWGNGRQVSYNVQRDNRGSMQQNLSYSDFHSPDTSWNISAGTRRDDFSGGSSNFSGSVQSRLPWGQVAADATLQPGQYRSLGLSWYGSATATRHGAALSQSLSGNEPRMMIDADGVAGVPVAGGSGVTNPFGIAVVSGGGSYQRSDIAVDVTALPDDVEVNDSVISQVLTEGAIGYRKINASQGEQVMGNLRLADGKAPPFGAQVVSSRSGRTLGMVGDDGLAYLTGISSEDRQAIAVSWNGNIQCRLTLPEKVTLSQGPLLLPCR
ncbi:fimbrial outer membrane usher protein StdB [Salmonella enterica subsp. enterica serovar Arechavaleta]|uniref:Fimbrial outer membrane usher protein StdB n=1 Tax=Salmonella enterica TaxID=28901 RepID=A0A755VBS6_SALER|nr:fimbrial outer membrane usher protein StdB [Salmonella enterica subsp. enterica serovar Arechavaleta]EAO6400840.1 fimbrial outer membrane usher protein StdB [Salmonella enterica]EDQ3762489.1 fimbrial outer membrane usher protein StdB [Salmonella enterica subsp. enterica]EBL2097141.1 fimbrial outer membrane usher protein StdB [Salmonella enterica]EBQ4646374.1 fimbrial outer membrane usher protein StdB [Salmonella enterica]